MSNFVSYKNLSFSVVTFTSQLSSVEIPKNVQDALKIPEWKEVVLEKMRTLEKNKTWEVVTLPKGKTTIGCKWVFTIKYNSDGSLQRYKACFVAKGFAQTCEIDYSKTFSPIAKLNTVRFLLSVVVNLNWSLQQLDVKNVFLNGDLKEEVYMDIPLDFDKRVDSKVCKLQKSLHSLKHSPRVWFERLTRSMKKIGFCQGQTDHTLFLKYSLEVKVTILIVYVDDIILTKDNIVEI